MPSGTDAQIVVEAQFELDARVRPGAASPFESVANFQSAPASAPAPPATPPPDAPPAAQSNAPAPSAFGQALDSLQSTQAGLAAFQAEIDNLKNEITLLRSRDETLKFYML